MMSSLFEAALDMWKHHNRDHHHCENGNDVSVETKLDCQIKLLYGKKPLVMNNNVNTYFDLELDKWLKGSLQSKRDWIIRCEHLIHASIKHAKQNTLRDHDPIWKHKSREISVIQN